MYLFIYLSIYLFIYLFIYLLVNLLDHYALCYLKWVDLLNTSMVTEKTSFLSEDEEIIIKYSKVWKKIFLYDKKYVKAKRNIR